MKCTLLMLLLLCALICGCTDESVSDVLDTTDTAAVSVSDASDMTDTAAVSADTTAPFLLVQSFGEYDYFLRDGSDGEARIMRGDDVIFSGFGTFREVGGFPVFSQSHHNGSHAVFDRDFNPIADAVVTYGEMHDGSILAHRRENDLSELIRIDPDGSLHLLGQFADVYAIINEGDFALVRTCIQNESLASAPYCTLTVIDKSGDTLAYLDKIEQDVRFMEISGDIQDGMWIFTFSPQVGDGIIYNYDWNQRAITHHLETEYLTSDNSVLAPRKEDNTDYLAITETNSGVDCLFLDGDTYKCRRITRGNHSIIETVSDVEEWSGGAFAGYKSLASAAHADHACWVVDENDRVVFAGCGIVSEIGGFPVFFPSDNQLPKTFLTHDFEILCDGVTDFEIEASGDIIARKVTMTEYTNERGTWRRGENPRLVRIAKDETVTDMGEYDSKQVSA